MHIKIYFNNKPLFLCEEIDAAIEPYLHHHDAVFMDDFSTPAINTLIHEMQQEKIHAGIFKHTNLQELKKAVWKKFIPIHAGGGLVLNEKKEILFIFRRGAWDLPKGKLDKGETIEACALREVREETGLQQIKLGQFLLATYHTYQESGKNILKESHWYTMYAGGNQTLVPQTEEDISSIKWMNKNQLPTILPQAFPSIKDVLLAYEAV